MTITEAQYRRIEACFPRQRGNVSISNLEVLNAILYVAEHGCKWRGLPRSFGNWHTIYTRMNRWAKAGVLDRVFAALQEQQIIRIKIEALSIDSAIVNVHPDGTSAPKKRPAGHRQGRTDQTRGNTAESFYRLHPLRTHRRTLGYGPTPTMRKPGRRRPLSVPRALGSGVRSM